MTPPPTTATSNVLLRSRNVSLPAPALPGSGSDGRRILVSALSAQAGGAPVDANPSAPVLPDSRRGRKTPTVAVQPICTSSATTAPTTSWWPRCAVAWTSSSSASRTAPTRRSSLRHAASGPPATPTTRCSSSTTVPTWSTPPTPTGSTWARRTPRWPTPVSSSGRTGSSAFPPTAPRRSTRPPAPTWTTSASAPSTRRRPSPAVRPWELELVRYAASNAAVPFFAIGGISPANVNDVAAAGAERIAVVRALTDAADPERTAGELRTAVDRAGARVGST